MDKYELEKRTKDFAIMIVRFVSGIMKDPVHGVIARQLLKSGTSIGANYREANRAESYGDFIHKISIVVKEAAETQYWLEICQQLNLPEHHNLAPIMRECSELLAIFAKIRTTSKKRAQ
ncbi:MAG: four helix bundle protein [Anaerolineales bacterium]|nr:four helix bundle protein [Anaerolineales bacterium]